METLEHSSIAGGNVKWFSCYKKNSLEVPQEAKHRIST